MDIKHKDNIQVLYTLIELMCGEILGKNQEKNRKKQDLKITPSSRHLITLTTLVRR